MMKKYFKNVKTKEELRKEYVKLAKANHPDNGGNAETFKAIQNEYDYLSKILPNAKATTEQEAEQQKHDEMQIDEALKDMIDRIIIFDGLNIEVVGSWIWVDGNTFQCKEQLKELGFKWSKARKKWHYTPYDSVKYYKGKRKDFDTLREMYGSSKVYSNITYIA